MYTKQFIIRDSNCFRKLIFTHSQSLLNGYVFGDDNNNQNNNDINNSNSDKNNNTCANYGNIASMSCMNSVNYNNNNGNDNINDRSNNMLNNDKKNSIVFIPPELDSYETSEKLLTIICDVYNKIGANWSRFA